MNRDDWSEVGLFWMAALHQPKGGQAVRLTRKGKGTKWMVVTDGNGLSLAVLLDRAQKAEIRLAEKTLNLVWVPKNGPGRPKSRPKELVADWGTAKPFASTSGTGVFILTSQSEGGKPRLDRRPDTSSDRLHRIIERTLARLGNYRRQVVRYERHLSVYQGFFNLAGIKTSRGS